MSAATRTAATKPTLAIIGSGWGGFPLTQHVSLQRYNIVVISPLRTIQYTPLLASAACGLFNFRLAEEPVRRRHRSSLVFHKALAEQIDFNARTIRCRAATSVIPGGPDINRGSVPENAATAEERDTHHLPTDFEVRYDKLVLAPGCTIQDFGTPGAREHALFLRTVADARAMQQRLLEVLDTAGLPTTTEAKRRELLHVRIVGGGAVGIEAAAELYDLWHEDMRFLYPDLDRAGGLRITIHDVAPAILSTFDARLGEYAASSLKGRHVELKTSSHIERVEGDAIFTKEDGRLGYGMLIWATGNKVNPLVAGLQGVRKTEKGVPRVLTDRFLRVKKEDGGVLEDVYAIGDAADVEGESLPMLAEVALQKGEYLTTVLNGDAREVKPFEYKQRALVAYLGRHDGVIGGREEWTGMSAWLAWRSGSLAWTRSWRRRFMIGISWLFVWLGGRDIARP